MEPDMRNKVTSVNRIGIYILHRKVTGSTIISFKTTIKVQFSKVGKVEKSRNIEDFSQFD